MRAPKSQWGSFGHHKALKLPGTPQIKSQWSKEQAGAPEQELLGPLEQAGLLNKEPTGPLWKPWVMGPLEKAGAPDQEPMESHGTSRGSRSKGNGPLEPGALNYIRVNWAPLDTITPGPRWGSISTANPYQQPIGP